MSAAPRLDDDVPVHAPSQPARERKPETCALIAAGARGSAADARLEDPVVLIVRDAGPIVLDRIQDAAVGAFLPMQTPMTIAAGTLTAPALVAAASNELEIKSPMIGTFYRAPSPEAANYVEVGSEVNSDTVVCIIEAMKVMNEIKAEIKGVITQILSENAKPVEFGQPLFKIRPT